MEIYSRIFVFIFALTWFTQSGVSGYTEQGTIPNTSNDANFYDGDHEQGYVEVREGAFMFWWLYYAGGDKETAYDKPLIIWVQGGPGIPASGVGNFIELGPQDTQLQYRNSSWVHKRNVLFIDSPVGTGFSYVKNNTLLVKTDNQVARDLVELTKQFLVNYPKFRTVPTHIFSQSYGGKIAPRFAYHLHEEIQANRMIMNLKTVGLGSAFVSPKDFALAYSDYLYNLGFIDESERVSIRNLSLRIAEACDKQEFSLARKLDIKLLAYQCLLHQKPVNVYNVIKGTPENPTAYSNINPEVVMDPFMNTIVKKALPILAAHPDVTWLYSNDIMDYLDNEFMTPSSSFVEKLLNETNITIAVYNGQLDLTTNIPGALQWVHRLKWSGAEKFKVARRQKIRGDGNGYYKRYGQLSFWWVHKAGHSISYDNPEVMEYILTETMDNVYEDTSSNDSLSTTISLLRQALYCNM